jgi:adenylyltransferase/sulfurtransferase
MPSEAPPHYFNNIIVKCLLQILYKSIKIHLFSIYSMEKYSRQHLYKNIGKEGQIKLSKSTVCIIGIGALGTVASDLLARAGVGRLNLIDRDFVEENNLQRQILFSEEDIGKPKASVALEMLSRINKSLKITARVSDLTYENIAELVEKPDLILGCTDNMETRFLINEYSKKNHLSWIYGGAVADRGSVYPVIPGRPCFRCIFSGNAEDTCDTAGILSSVSMITASIMANEAIKILVGSKPEEDLIHFDLWKNEFSKIKVPRDLSCLACNGKYDYLLGKSGIRAQKLCGKGSFQIAGKKKDLKVLKKKLEELGEVKAFGGIIHFNGLSVFEDGRAIIKAKSMEEARSIYSRYVGN